MNATDRRDEIRAEIAGIQPMDDLEAAHRAEALAWVDSGVELCRLAKPATPPRHLVSYFVLRDGARLLLVDHRNAELWLPTGGHVEPGEHPRETVRRELAEELGLALPHPVYAPTFITSTQTVGHTSGHWDVSLWYVLNTAAAPVLRFDESEFSAVRWFRADEVPLHRTDPHLGRFIRKLMAEVAA